MEIFCNKVKVSWIVRVSIILFTIHYSLFTAMAQRMADVAEHSKYIQAVDEYRPAPGQHVNENPDYEEGDTPETIARKCTELIANNERHLISLGGWGGYITFHFDHSIANVPGERDFAIWGNAYQEFLNLVYGGINEAGIVQVSQDVNGNGLPDDPWYEISGSCDEDSIGLVDYDYEITYQRNPMGDIPWTDNRGGSGTIDRLDRWHTQEYYPQWLPDGLTFRGTRLPRNNWDYSAIVSQDVSQYYWVLISFRYGYADNHPNTLSDYETPNVEGCGIDISWAVDEQRRPVSLRFIDFVRVYTGLNQKSGWLGETSTEILGAEDLHLEASLNAIREALAGMKTVIGDGGKRQGARGTYDLRGARSRGQGARGKGVYIQNGKKYIIK